jgi:NADPH:quinone reductase-like Zn-dependent oxidoreductase
LWFAQTGESFCAMKAMRFNDSPDLPALDEATVPTPEAGPGEILVRVHASGVTPTELRWHPTTHTREGGERKGAIPGHEFSGVIEKVGEGVDTALVGREVFGMNDWFAEGSAAEYVVTKPANVTAKPARLSHPEAASVPISALTAWQGLYDRGRPQPGETVLIHGGAGAVGIFAIQLARRAKARVITTSDARHADFLRKLGASEVVDYRSTFFEDHVPPVDVIFDTAGGSTLQRSWKVLKPGGRMVTIASSESGSQDERTKAAFFIVEPKGEQLAQIAELLQSGELQPCVDGIIPFAQASDAYLGIVPRNYGRGKVVIAISS